MVEDASCHLSCYISTHKATWRHRSRDHLAPGSRLPMGGP